MTPVLESGNSDRDKKEEESSVEMDDSGRTILNQYTETWRFQAMQPMIWAMKACGLYFTRDYNPVLTNGPHYKRTKVRPTPSWIYSTFLLVYVWIEQVRYCFGFDSADGYMPETFQKVVALIWSLNMSINITEFYRACMTYECIPELFIFAGCLKRRCDSFLRKKTAGVTLVCVIAILTNTGFAIYQAFYLAGKSSLNHDWPLSESSSIQAVLVVRILFVLSLALRSCYWTLPAGLTLICSCMLKKEFTFLREDLKTAINRGSLQEDLPTLRKRFQLVCKLVDNADDILGRYLAFCILLSVAILILNFYNCLFWSEALADNVILIVTLFWMIGCLTSLAIVCGGTATVNTEAHGIAPVLHEIVLTEETSHLAIEVTMFLQRLSGDDIGLTAWRMFVINRPTILTVAGMMVSYLIILVQSSPGATTTTSCDFSSLLANISQMINSTRDSL